MCLCNMQNQPAKAAFVFSSSENLSSGCSVWYVNVFFGCNLILIVVVHTFLTVKLRELLIFSFGYLTIYSALFSM